MQSKQQKSSLLKYDPPVLTSSITDKRAKFVGSSEKVETMRMTQTDDILHTILPPRYVYECSIHLTQRIYRG